MNLTDTKLQRIDILELQLLLSPTLDAAGCALVVELSRVARKAVRDAARPVVVERIERKDFRGGRLGHRPFNGSSP